MLPGPLCWFLGALLLIGGVLASLYLVWLQVRRGVTGFSMLATSDALATVAISIAFFLNASQNHNDTRRIATNPTECSPSQLAMASALFLAPFINTFVSMVAHSAESSHSILKGDNAPRGWRVVTSPRMASSIAAQWLVPIISALLLLSANIQHSRPYKSDTETCLSDTAMVPMSVETAEECLHQEDISNYITSIMNNPNYSFIHNQAAINVYRQEALNNSDVISNETSLIVDKIYNILLGSLKSLNHTYERKQHNFSFPSRVSMLRNSRSIRENNSASRQFSSTQGETEDNYYNRDDDSTYYSTSNEDSGNKDENGFEYPNYEIQDTDIPTASQQVLNTEENVGEKPNTNSLLSTHDQQFEDDVTEASGIAESANTNVVSSSSQQAERNFSTVKFNISPTTTLQSLLITNKDTSAQSTKGDSTMSVTPGLESSNSESLANGGTEAISQTPAADQELATTSKEFTFQQQTSASIESVTESQISTQTEEGLIHVQIPDTVNLCVVKCYFSGSFLKKYLFVLLFLCYFVPILASMVIYVATGKHLTMVPSAEVKPQEEPSTTAEQNDVTKTACDMHLARMVSASNTVKHFITTGILMWTPTFVETLLRVWFCINTPEWLTTVLFVLGQTNTIIRNVLNLRLIRSHACSGTVQPLEVEQGKANHDIPTKLFTKVKAVFLQ